MKYTFMQLMRSSRQYSSDLSDVGMRIAILADSATQHLKTAVLGMGREEKFPVSVFEADYDQIEIQVFDPASKLYRYEPEMILLFMSTQKLYEAFCESKERKRFAENVFQKIRGYYDALESGSNAKIIQPLFLEINDMVFGNFGMGVAESFICQTKKLNLLLMQYQSEDGNVFLIDLNRILAENGSRHFFDHAQYCNSKLAISLESLPDLAHEIISIAKAIKGHVRKCIVLDLDNTLWGGVIGDDGLDGIELGELGAGHAFCEFQLWLRELKRRGIILCVCSKNNEDIAKEPFEKHPDMMLKLDDIALFVANWEDKASNIRYIQETLNIGMDSMVFIDDNPFERELVKSAIPDITVPDMPEDPALYVSCLQTLNLFETVSYSENDEKRTKQYQEEIGRKKLEKSFHNLDDYLIGLQMEGAAAAFSEFYYPRIAQLTQRSNQFNLRTIRYTEADIEKIAKDDRYLTLYFTLKDKFGDYGLVSVVIMEKQGETGFIDTWLMSCRVLKRGMEEFVINAVVAAAGKAGIKKVVGEYIPTRKNAMVSHLYEGFGFKATEKENRYEMIVDEFLPCKNHIKSMEV